MILFLEDFERNNTKDTYPETRTETRSQTTPMYSKQQESPIRSEGNVSSEIQAPRDTNVGTEEETKTYHAPVSKNWIETNSNLQQGIFENWQSTMMPKISKMIQDFVLKTIVQYPLQHDVSIKRKTPTEELRNDNAPCKGLLTQPMKKMKIDIHSNIAENRIPYHFQQRKDGAAREEATTTSTPLAERNSERMFLECQLHTFPQVLLAPRYPLLPKITNKSWVPTP